MKIALTVTLDVDPHTWAAAYGIGPDAPGGLARAVRDDVRASVANTLQAHYVDDLCLVRDTVVKAPSTHRPARLSS